MTKNNSVIKIEDLKAGDHLCFLYNDESEYTDLLKAFIIQGLIRREKVLCICKNGEATHALESIDSNGIKIEQYIKSGQLSLQKADSVYLKDNIFDPATIISELKTQTQNAIKEGYQALRVSGTTIGDMSNNINFAQVIEFESKLHSFFHSEKCIALCNYNINKFDPDFLLKIVLSHPLIFYENEVYRNNFYTTDSDESQYALQNYLRCIEGNNNKINEELEIRVLHRTEELLRANKLLTEEIKKREKTDKELRKSEERYKNFYDNNPSMFFTIDLEGTIVSVNNYGAMQLGYEVDELLGQSVNIVLHPDDVDYVSDQLNTCINNPGKMLSWEFRKIRKDREVMWVKENARTTEDPNGNLLVLIVCTDITKQKKAESLLSGEEKTLEMIKDDYPLNEILHFLCGEIEKLSDDMLCSFLKLNEDNMSLQHLAAPSLPKSFVSAMDNLIIGSKSTSFGAAAYWNERVIVYDIETDPIWGDWKDIALNHSLRSCWSVPVISSDKKLLGTFAIYYKHPRTPETHELSLIDRATYLARLAIEKKHSEEIMKSNLERLTKKSKYEEVITTVTQYVHQSIDIQEVLDNAVEAMCNNIESTKYVGIWFIEENEAVLRSHSGYPGWFIEQSDRIPRPKSFIWKTVLDGKARHISDTENGDTLTPAGKQLGTKSYFCVPICHKNTIVGAIAINSLEENAFKEEELHLIEIVTQQLEIAINNARQAEALRASQESLTDKVNELSRKRRYEEIINSVTRSVHSSINLHEVMDNAVDSIDKNIQAIDLVAIYLVNDDYAVLKTYREKRISIKSPAYDVMSRIPKPKGFIWKTIIDRKPVYCPNTENDNVIGKTGKDIGTKSYLSIPINAGDKTIGTLSMNSVETDAFDEEHLKLLEIVSNQISVAINNAKQADELRKARDKLDVRVFQRTADLIRTNGLLQKEIGDRTNAENRIKQSLEEKELLLKEIHHRVKNNLQLISSLISLQSDYFREDEVLDMLADSQNRIKTLAMIHEQLYQSTDLAKIDIADYIRDLVDNLFDSYQTDPTQIKANVKIKEIFMDINHAIPCGLIINEIVSNSLKHAFPNSQSGEICVELIQNELSNNSNNNQSWRLVIGDNGIGFPADLDFRNTESLGLQLVNTLAKQLKGTLELISDNGTSYEINFNS